MLDLLDYLSVLNYDNMRNTMQTENLHCIA